MLLRCLFVVLTTSLVTSPFAFAQTTTATLTGTLTDPSGASVADAEISARHLPASASQPAILARSDGNGRFMLLLPSGTYRVRIAHSSFEPMEREITLSAGLTRELSLRLELERLAATVIVSEQAEPVAIEATTAPVDVVTQEEIERRQVVSLPALLATLPGFSLGRTGREGGVTSLFLDGGNFDFTKVQVDGTTVNEPGGAVDFSNFTLDNVQKIEVVHGAESALFGSDAVAGVVEIFTHRGSTELPQLTLLAEGGGFSSARGAAQWSGLVNRFDYSTAAAYFTTDGQGPNDRFLNRTLSGNFGWRFGEANSLRLALRNNTSDAGVAGQTLLTAPDLNQHNGLENFSSNLRWDFQTGSHWHHQLVGAESYLRQLFADPPIFTVRNQLNRAGFVGQSSYLFPQGTLTAGYQYEVENGWVDGPHFRRNNQGGYLDTRLQPVRRVMLTAGVRAEANDSFGTRVIPRAGIAYALRFGHDFWGATRLRFSYGQGIKEPSLIQSFSRDPCFPGNPTLRPERSRTYHAGIEQTLASDRIRLSGDYFQNNFQDIVSFTFVAFMGAPGFCGGFSGTFFNTDLARARGVNFVAESRPFRWLRISANYSYDDTRVLKAPNALDPASIPGNHLLRRPVHSGHLVLNAAFRRMNWNLLSYFTGQRTDSSFLAPGVTTLPGYVRFDLAGSYALGRAITLFGRVENLLDKQYQEVLGFPALGRDYRLGMKFTLGGKEKGS